jgi:hypothetical protein
MSSSAAMGALPRAKSHCQVPQGLRLRLAMRGAKLYGLDAELAD